MCNDTRLESDLVVPMAILLNALKERVYGEDNQYTTDTKLEGYGWKETKKNQYIAELRSLNDQEIESTTNLEGISKRIKMAMNKAGMGTEGMDRKPWFDNECKMAKSVLNRSCRDIKEKKRT
jgi:hypothetical protein